MPKSDLLGQTFGRLCVVSEYGRNRNRNVLWECRCSCGNKTYVTTHDLNCGHTRSCGCLKTEETIKRNTREGQAKRSNDLYLYKVWAAMKQRCLNPNNKRYHDYGGRGITISESWMEYDEFYAWAIEHGYKRGLDIDRIDNNKGYSPDNCRFVTRKQNCRNKRDNRFITLMGQTRVLQEWCDIFGLDSKVVSHRISRGTSHEEAITRGLSPDKLSAMMEAWDGKSGS